MIIGITGSNNNEVESYLYDKYSYKYLDVNEIIEKILSKQELKEFIENKSYKENITFFLKVRNKIDEEIKKAVDSIKEDETLVINYSLLEDSYMFPLCDLTINLKEKTNENSNLTLLKKYKGNKIKDPKKYHLELDLNKNWQDKLSSFIDYNMHHKTKVTVVVPIYNTSEYLTTCINSIINQTYKNLEIILIDDGSTDETLQICNVLAKKDKRIKVIHQENKGLAETRNKGMDLATGEYICFIDSDDYIEKDMIETLLKTIEETKADICEGSFYIHQKDGTIVDTTIEQKGKKYISDKKELIEGYADATILIPAWDKIYKLSSIKNIKFNKNVLKEDSDYIYKLCKEGKTFALVDKPFYHYIKRPSTSLTGSKINEKLFTLQTWGKEKYKEVMSFGEEYKDAAEKILYNSLVHILRNYKRDYNNKVLKEGEFKEEIESVTNDLIELLLHAKDVKKFRKLDEVLEIIKELVNDKVLNKDKMPSVELPCIGILWNSLSIDQKQEAINFINNNAELKNSITIDFKEDYRKFIDEIYLYNKEFEGISVIKAGTLIDKYDSNSIIILNMVIKVTNYIYFNDTKGYMFEEVAALKSFIRKYFKTKIKDYAYDNIFHLTVDDNEYDYTEKVCKKFVREHKKDANI